MIWSASWFLFLLLHRFLRLIRVIDVNVRSIYFAMSSVIYVYKFWIFFVGDYQICDFALSLFFTTFLDPSSMYIEFVLVFPSFSSTRPIILSFSTYSWFWCELTEFIDKTTLKYNGGDNRERHTKRIEHEKERKNERKTHSHGLESVQCTLMYAYAQKSDCRCTEKRVTEKENNNAYSNITIQYSFIILKRMCVCVCVYTKCWMWNVLALCVRVFTQFHANGEWKWTAQRESGREREKARNMQI